MTSERAGTGRPAAPFVTPLAAAVARVGDRWTLLLVEALLGGPRRFNDLLDAVPGLAPNILTQRLRHLQREQLVVARAYSNRPPRYAYDLSAAGRDLADSLRLLAAWGARHEGGAAGADWPRHVACGTALETRWYCPTCGDMVRDPADGTAEGDDSPETLYL